MGRWRAPQPRASLYITPAGFKRLQDEYAALWDRRADVTRALAAAAAEGDRSENAEYIYRKKELRGLDRRIRYLEKRLPELKVVDTPPADTRRIFFAARVTLEDEAGEELRLRIVGADEFDPARSWISVDSPMARALLGKAVDDEVSVETPKGARRYWVTEIDYAAGGG